LNRKFLPDNLKILYHNPHNCLANLISIFVNDLHFNDQGVPTSRQFNDIYFDRQQGCEQSEAIFIQGNRLEQRFHALLTQHALAHPTELFSLAETGFGTGLNFLLAWRCYQQAKVKVNSEFITHAMPNKLSKSPVWQFISVEKYPLHHSELQRSLALFPELAQLSNELLKQYPATPNEHLTLYFADGEIQLTLLFDEVVAGLGELPCPRAGLVDAWLLDGFCPDKNPEMWRTEVFQQLARLSKPQASLATFTVAGTVRRGLQAEGFRVAKQACAGQAGAKNQLLVATYQQNSRTLGYQLRPPRTKPQQVSIIGGGIAAACVAYSLTQQGIKVRLFCKDAKLGQGASSNAIGALYPLIRQRPDQHSRFYQQAFWHAKQYYQRLLADGFYFSHQWCGLLDLAYNQALLNRQQKFSDHAHWSPTLIHGVDADQASALAGIKLTMGGLFMPEAGWLAPQELVQQLIAAACATNRLTVHTEVNINKLSQNADLSWQLTKANSNKTYRCQQLILCAGAEGIALEYCQQLPLSPLRGQVTQVRSTQAMASLKTVLCHKGYVTPAHQGRHCIGATFTKHSLDFKSTEQDDQQNLATLNECLPRLTNWGENDIVDSNARSRCMTPDHLPIVGGMPDIAQHRLDYPHLAKDKNWRYKTPASYLPNLYLLTGLGARGLCSAPLLADILCAELCGTPFPVDDELLFNLSANRFVIKELIKQQKSPA
jgi:tRNA 5-methylaminomethyl-2-thiouridine biosynthesis bifunctional protein